MSRIIILAGALALAVAGTTTVAFRTIGAGTWSRPPASDPLGEHLRAMHNEMALP
jgi:chorismate-pyruvate lyase